MVHASATKAEAISFYRDLRQSITSHTILGGDFNVDPDVQDHNVKMRQVLDLGIDVLKQHNTQKRVITRPHADKAGGARLDYFLVSPTLADFTLFCGLASIDSEAVQSDHLPVTLSLDNLLHNTGVKPRVLHQRLRFDCIRADRLQRLVESITTGTPHALERDPPNKSAEVAFRRLAVLEMFVVWGLRKALKQEPHKAKLVAAALVRGKSFKGT